MKHRFVPVCTAVVAAACFSHAVSAVTLYDPALGSTMAAQGWDTQTIGATVTPTVSSGRYRVDTTAVAATYSGSALYNQPLATDTGFTLTFDLQVLAESHADSTRSGFSVIVVGANPADSLELAFWGDRVWSYGAGFAHGADALLDTSLDRVYSLTVQNQQFTLSTGGSSLLSGGLVDYSARGLIYSMPGSLFFGDDSTRGASSVALGPIAISAIPEPATAGLFLLGGALIAVRKRRPRG